jgi:hypothetical protein
MGGVMHVESDVPGDMTLDEWRRTRHAPRHRRWHTRVADRLRRIA